MLAAPVDGTISGGKMKTYEKVRNPEGTFHAMIMRRRATSTCQTEVSVVSTPTVTFSPVSSHESLVIKKNGASRQALIMMLPKTRLWHTRHMLTT